MPYSFKRADADFGPIPLIPGILSEVSPCNAFTSINLEKQPNYKPIEITAYVTRVKQHKTKTKEQMAFLTFDTGDGEIELIAFADVYKPNKKLLKKDSIIKATIKKTNKGIQLLSVAN